jgi:hypothetical protein
METCLISEIRGISSIFPNQIVQNENQLLHRVFFDLHFEYSRKILKIYDTFFDKSSLKHMIIYEIISSKIDLTKNIEGLVLPFLHKNKWRPSLILQTKNTFKSVF